MFDLHLIFKEILWLTNTPKTVHRSIVRGMLVYVCVILNSREISYFSSLYNSRKKSDLFGQMSGLFVIIPYSLTRCGYHCRLSFRGHRESIKLTDAPFWEYQTKSLIIIAALDRADITVFRVDFTNMALGTDDNIN